MTEPEMRHVSHAIGMLFRQVEQISVVTEATMTALAVLIDDRRPEDDAEAAAWLMRLRDVAIANVEMRAATLRLNAMAEGRTDTDSTEAAEEHKRQLVETLRSYFGGIANGEGQPG